MYRFSQQHWPSSQSASLDPSVKLILSVSFSLSNSARSMVLPMALDMASLSPRYSFISLIDHLEVIRHVQLPAWVIPVVFAHDYLPWHGVLNRRHRLCLCSGVLSGFLLTVNQAMAPCKLTMPSCGWPNLRLRRPFCFLLVASILSLSFVVDGFL